MNTPVNSDRVPDMSDRDRIEALLPFYLNGTLDADDLVLVQAWLDSSPDASAALAAAEAESDASVSANEAISLPPNALGRLNTALDAEAGTTCDAAGPSWIRRVAGKILGAPPALAWGTAAAALALVVVQAVTLPGNPSRDRPETFSQAGVSQFKDDSPYVLVVFAPGADIARISALLAQTGASIASGPKPGGVYFIDLPAEDMETYARLSAVLAASPVVKQLLPGRKPAEAY